MKIFNITISSDITQYDLIVYVFIIIVLGFCAVIFLICLLRERKGRHRLKKVHRNPKKTKLNRALIDRVHHLPYEKEYELPRESLEVGTLLGAGFFGVVHEGVLLSHGEKTKVAIKMIKDVSDYKIVEDFISELKVMMYLGQHSNVLNLLGVVTSNITQNELMIIVEYCEYGNVSDLLRNNRSQFINQINFKYDIIDSTIRKRNKIYAKRLTSNCDNSTDEISNKLTIEPITTTDLVYWSLQVAQGMDYLTSRKILHRDLAARNILLCPNNVVKICDFGMARILQNDEYHIEHRRELIPFKYWPPESLQKQKFSVYSDVWSFGIVMWEMFSLGSPPYPDVDSFSELCKRLDDGYRLSKPLYATEAIYNIMISCWNDDHKLRPLFDLLEMNISQLLHPVFSSSMESFECESDKDDCKYGSRSLEYSCSSSNRNNK